MLKTNAENGHKSLVIMDDVSSALKDKEVQRYLRIIGKNRRHLKTTVICLLQSYFDMPLAVREQATNLIVFKCNKTQMEKLFREQIDTAKDKFIDICNYCYKNEHDYMFVNTTSKRIYNTDWNEIIYENQI